MRMPRLTPWLVVVTLTAAGAAAAAGYGLTAPKRYRAQAQLLVIPMAANDSTFAGLDVLRDAAGKRTAAATAAQLLRSPQVSDAVRAQLGLRQSSAALLDELHVHVADSSDVVDVAADDTSPPAAAQLANAFVDALIAQRTASFQSALGSAIRRDAQLLAGGAGPQAVELARRLAVLRSLQGQPDPTLRRGGVAVAPATSSWPDLPRAIAVGTGAGLAVGVLLAGLLLALRRREPSGLSAYDRPVSDRSERAAQELADRLEQRLAGRERALAARERDLQARIDELKALDADSPADRERELEERVAHVARRELEAARPAAAVAGDVRDEREAELAEREHQLEERIARVTRRELELARRAATSSHADEAKAAELAQREASLIEREHSLEARLALHSQREAGLAERAAAPPPAVSAPAPAVPSPAAEDADGGGAYNLVALEQLVEARAADFPDRAEEWQSYLFFLRDYARPGGALPSSFDWLILDTFRELVA
jgi:Chain length determinant protein